MGPLPCCVASARCCHPLVISSSGRDYDQLRRQGNMRDQAAILYCCIVPFFLPCPSSKPMAIEIMQWRAGKSILYGERNSQSGLAQVRLPDPGGMLSIVCGENKKAKGRSPEPGTVFPVLPLMPTWYWADDSQLLQLPCLLYVSIAVMQWWFLENLKTLMHSVRVKDLAWRTSP